jgi:transcriptional regulator with XRE-family HTH domain
MRLTSDSVGRRLAAIRTDRGLTQAALAAAIGKSRQCVCHWERGSSDLRISDLHRLAEALDCRLRDLLAPPEAPIPSLHPRRKRRRSVSHLDEAPAPRHSGLAWPPIDPAHDALHAIERGAVQGLLEVGGLATTT